MIAHVNLKLIQILWIWKIYRIFNKKGQRLGKKNHREFSLEKMAIRFNKVLDDVLKQIPSAMSLKLPKLKKFGGKQK